MSDRAARSDPGPATRAARRKKRVRIAAGLGVLLGSLGAGGAWLAVRTLPAYAGAATVSGIAAEVAIVRDAHAIPHIFAKGEADAYFALGYVHAQDRMWQLELNRRVGRGTLAELVGEKAIARDRLFRTLGLAEVAARTLAQLDAETRVLLDAYARGINAWLDEGNPLPPEFLLFGGRPAPWTPADSVLFSKLMGFQLSGNWSEELLRVRLGGQLDPAQQASFSPPHEGDAPIPFRELFRSYDALELGLTPARRTRRDLLPALAPAAAALAGFAPAKHGEAIGSNNWAVDGTRTASGKPLLANDPHLALTAPTQWYLAHLEAPGLSVIGATLPALPGVILGRNRAVAWAFTNTHPDTEDVYIERLAPGDDQAYQTPEGPRPFERVRETIKVKGGDEVVHWVRRTRHGPVISDVSDDARGLMPDGYVLALRWTGLSDDDETVAFPMRAAHAAHGEALREAARSFHQPTQNIVYGDVHGAIGFVAAGKVPVRRGDNPLKGLVPSPGWLALYDWTGVIPFDALPQQTQPVSGRIVTANQNIVPAGFPYFMGADWGPPYRHDRIATLLDARRDHDLASFSAIQRDQRSTVAERLVPAMLAALGSAGSPDVRAAADALARWDRTMRADAYEPLVFAAWLRELGRLVYEDELGALFVEASSVRPEFIAGVLSDHEGRAKWCDDVRTAEVERCAAITARALTDALVYLEARFGADRRSWTWGAAHPAVAAHAVLGGVPVLSRWFDVATPHGGDSSTIDVGSYGVDDPDTAFENDWGASFRALYDFGDLERSQAILNTGQSGNALSPHYRDMNALWAAGAYVPLSTERAQVEALALGTLVLRPR